MTVVETILNKVETATNFPVIITNKEFLVIEVSSKASRALEEMGYKVETFANLETGIYGFSVNK